MTYRDDVRRTLRYHLKAESPSPQLVNELVDIVTQAMLQAANDESKRQGAHSGPVEVPK